MYEFSVRRPNLLLSLAMSASVVILDIIMNSFVKTHIT